MERRSEGKGSLGKHLGGRAGKRMSMPGPSRGEVWDLDLDPTVGHEQAGAKPALIVSVNIFNEGPAELVVAIPLTRTLRRVRWHVPVLPPEGGLVAESFIQCENLRAV